MVSQHPLYKDQFEPLIPHSGLMCLIDRVDNWDEHSIQCTSTSHRDPNNPLRLDGKLASLHLLEYGAQAMAIHGGLMTKTTSPGMLVAVRDVNIYIDDLDHIKQEIIIRTYTEINTTTGASYQFTITDSGNNELLSARATVINQWEK